MKIPLGSPPEKGEIQRGLKTMEVTTTIPTQFRSGETIIWKLADSSDYPQLSGFTAKATISGAGGNASITGQFSDGYWTFTLLAKDNNLAAGEYVLYIFFTKGAGDAIENYPSSENTLTVKAKLTTAVSTDQRTHAQKMLALIEAALEGFATDGIQSAEIAGRSYTKADINDLHALRVKYYKKVHGISYQTVPVVW
jgi:hypothetical protein